MRRALIVVSLWLVLVWTALADPARNAEPLPEVALAPKFSKIPLHGGVSGDAVVIGVVGESGALIEPAVESGHVALHHDALEAARGWRFPRGARGVKVRLVFSFLSLPADSKEEEAVLFYPPNRVEVRRKRPRPPDSYP
jgi:hypothetical protein